MHLPSVSDFSLLKRILRYVKGTLNHGISILANTHSTLVCYSDSDWAGCKDTRRSTGGFCTFLGSNIISWSAKRHDTVSKSSTEAEYRTMSMAASEVAWLQNLLKIMGLEQRVTPLLLCDNLSAVCLTANPRFHKRTKHFEVDFHYVRERVAMKLLEVKHIPASLQTADVFTKSLSQEAFYRLRNKLSVSLLTTLSVRGSNSKLGQTEIAQHEEAKVKPITLAPTVKSSTFNVQRSSRCTTAPAHIIGTSNRFECLTSCAVTC